METLLSTHIVASKLTVGARLVRPGQGWLIWGHQPKSMKTRQPKSFHTEITQITICIYQHLILPLFLVSSQLFSSENATKSAYQVHRLDVGRAQEPELHPFEPQTMMLSNAWAVDSVCPQQTLNRSGVKMMAFSKNVASIKMKMVMQEYLLCGQKVRGCHI